MCSADAPLVITVSLIVAGVIMLLIQPMMYYIASGTMGASIWLVNVKSWHFQVKLIGLTLKVFGSALEFGAEFTPDTDYSLRWVLSTVLELIGNMIILFVFGMVYYTLWKGTHPPTHITTDAAKEAYKQQYQCNAVKWAWLLCPAFLSLLIGAVLEYAVASQQRVDVDPADNVIWKLSAIAEIILASGLGVYCLVWVCYESYIRRHYVARERARGITNAIAIVVVYLALGGEIFGSVAEFWWAVCDGQTWWCASSICDATGFTMWSIGTLWELDARTLCTCRWKGTHTIGPTSYQPQTNIEIGDGTDV